MDEPQKGNETKQHDNPNVHHLSEPLNSTRPNSNIPNATIVCGERTFHVHKHLMGAVSPFFESAFTKGWKETSSSKIELPTVSASSMDAILSYIYTRKLKNISEDKEAVMKLLHDADYLQMGEFFERTFEMFSEKHLLTNDFYDIWLFLTELNSDGCLQKVTAFLARNYRDVAKSNDFLFLQHDHIKRILQHPNMNKSDMDYIFASLLKWTEFESGRLEFLIDILSVLDSWCPECLNDQICQNIARNWNFKITDWLTVLLESRLQKCSTDIQEKGADEAKIACFAESEDGKEQVMGILDTDHNMWLEKNRLPYKIITYQQSVLMYRNHVFLFGGQPLGRDNPEVTSIVFKYCPGTNTVLSSDGSLSCPVAQAGSSVLKDNIYVINGVNSNNTCLKTVQCYNPKRHESHLVASTNYGHKYPFARSFNDNLYVIGCANEDSQFLEKYDPSDDQWTVVTQVPDPFYRCTATGCGTQLFVLKYFELIVDEYKYNVNESQFHVYDLVTKRWTVRDFQGGPVVPWELIAVEVKSKPVIFAVDDFEWLYKYDDPLALWEVAMEPENGTMKFKAYIFTI